MNMYREREKERKREKEREKTCIYSNLLTEPITQIDGSKINERWYRGKGGWRGWRVKETVERGEVVCDLFISLHQVDRFR